MAKEFLKLNGKIILAPMHDITNIAFRLMCKKYGASLVWTELLSANALARRNKAVLNLALTDKNEKPVVGQIFGQNIENIIEAGKVIEGLGFDMLDFNVGCPSSKIMSQGSGGALLKRPKKIREIIGSLVKNVNIPVSVKIRKGIEGKDNSVEIASICEKEGVSCIIVHARTVEQGYSGKADWNIIKKVKEKVNVPVIGNGDVWNGEDASDMFKETGCDYIMVGRASIGNPFVFKQIEDYLKKGLETAQTKEEKIKDYFEYIELCKKFKIFNLNDARRRAQEFTRGLEGSSKLRRKLNNSETWEKVEAVIKEMCIE